MARYKWYQPTVQMVSGIGSCVVYAVALFFYKRHVAAIASSFPAHKLERQKRITKLAGSLLLPDYVSTSALLGLLLHTMMRMSRLKSL